MKKKKCVDCGKEFSEGKCIRCPECRKGKQGVPKGGAKGNAVCPKCGGRKHLYSRMCRKCYKAIWTELEGTCW